MVPYIVLYSILLFSLVFENRGVTIDTKKKVIFVLSVLFVLFRGLRWRLGTDWEQFYLTFQYADWGHIFNFVRYNDEKLEFGYVFLNVFIKYLGGNYTTFLLVTNAIILYFYSKFVVKNSRTPVLAFIIILFTTAFFPTRQLLASSIISLGYTYLIDKKLMKFIAVVLVASTIHTSAIIFIPFYFILNIKLPSYVAIGSFLSAVVFGNPSVQIKIMGFIASKLSVFGDAITHRLQVYMDYNDKQSIGRDSIVSNALILFFLVVFVYYRNKKSENKTLNIFFNSYLMYVLISAFFGESMQELARLNNFFIYGFPIVLAFVVSEQKGSLRLPAYVFLILYMYYKLLTTLFNFFPELHIPYMSVFDYM